MRLVTGLLIGAVVTLQAYGGEAAAGWYELDEGPRLVLPSARDGFRLASPDGHRFDWLAPSDGDVYEWRDGLRHREASVTFERDRGKVMGFSWTLDGKRGRARRAAEAPYRVEEVQFQNENVPLSGNVFLPSGTGPFPAVVFVHGSGTNNRDNSWLFRFADYFARRGVAGLLPDKRGGGKSGGDWRTVGLETYARDALAAVDYLRGRGDIGGIGLFGSSQGGQVVPIAGVIDPRLSFVVDVSGSLVPLGEQVRHEVEQDLRNDGATDDEIALAAELFTLSHAYIRTGTGWEAYAERLQAIRNSPLKRAAFGFNSNPESWYWDWWRKVIDVDPIEHWQALEIPGLIVYGRDDERDNVPVSVSMERFETQLKARENLTLRVFENTGHGLMDKERGDIREDFLEFLWGWMKPRVGQGN